MKKRTSAYLPFYVIHHLTDPKVRLMDFVQRAAHLELLLISWVEGPLPEDPYVLLEAPRGPTREDVDRVLGLAWERTIVDGSPGNGSPGWVSPRLELERQKYERRFGSEAQREKANKRYRRHADGSQRHADSCQVKVEVKAKESPEGLSSPSSEPKGSSEGTRSKASRPRKAPSGPQAEAMRLWEGLWWESRGCSWVWDTKHAVAVSRALKKAQGSLEEFEGRARRMLMEPPDRWMAQNASPAILDSRWNELSVTIATVKTDQERRQDAIQARLRRFAEGGGEPEGGRNGRPHSDRPPLLGP